MTTKHRIGSAALVAAFLALATAGQARADFLINNGGFEAGFASWTRQNQAGSEGTFVIQTGTSSPVNGDPVPAPPGGLSAAMTDAQGPGSHVLYQDFVVPVLVINSAVLKFDLFIGNRGTAFVTPAAATLDFSTPALNQQARVDILRAGTDPFSVAAADILQNVYQTRVGDPLVSGYTTSTIDLTALLAANVGRTLRLRFAETDNVFTFQLGVDNVSLTAVPEPSSVVLFGTGALLGLAGIRRRNRRAAR